MTVDDFGGAATGASAVLLGSLMGVTAQTVRTIELRAIAKLKKPSRMGLVMPFVDKTTRDAIEQAAFGDEEFATALASAVERADERAGGGRVFGRLRGGRWLLLAFPAAIRAAPKPRRKSDDEALSGDRQSGDRQNQNRRSKSVESHVGTTPKQPRAIPCAKPRPCVRYEGRWNRGRNAPDVFQKDPYVFQSQC